MQSASYIDTKRRIPPQPAENERAGTASQIVAHRLTILIAMLTALSSGVGLFSDTIYRDNTWARSGFRGNDLISLFLATPLLLGGLTAAQHGSARGHLMWLGMVAYTLYNYSFYIFGAVFNELFLVYAILVGASIWVLILGLMTTDPIEIHRRLVRDFRTKWVVANMVVIGLFLAIGWSAQAIRFVVDGSVPQTVIDSGIHTSIVFALDLTLIVPAMFIGARLLWRGSDWGYLFAGILMIKAAIYTIALITMSFFASASDIEGSWTLVPVWIVMSLFSLASCWFLLVDCRKPVPSSLD
jgi:hypothetical protein